MRSQIILRQNIMKYTDTASWNRNSYWHYTHFRNVLCAILKSCWFWNSFAASTYQLIENYNE